VNHEGSFQSMASRYNSYNESVDTVSSFSLSNI